MRSLRRIRWFAGAMVAATFIAALPAQATSRTVEARYDTPVLGNVRACNQTVGGTTYNVGKVCLPIHAGDARVVITAADDLTNQVELVGVVEYHECIGYGCRTFWNYPVGCGSLDIQLPPLTYKVEVDVRAVGYGSTTCLGARATSGSIVATFT